jgi:hypothetical protein
MKRARGSSMFRSMGRSMRSDSGAGAGTIVAIILGVVVVIAAGAAAYALTVGKPSPSGNGFDPAAFKSAMDKAGIEAPALDAPVDASKVTFEGSKKLDAEFTDAELTAMLNAVIVQTSIPVTNLAVNMHAGSTAKATGEGQYKGKWYSGWIQGPISVSGASVASPGNTGYGVAGVPVPLSQYEAQATEFALNVMNAHLAIVTGLQIAAAETAEGKVKVTGTVPAKMVVSP